MFHHSSTHSPTAKSQGFAGIAPKNISGRVVRLMAFLALFFISPGLIWAAQVTLAWDANKPAPDGYRLYQRTDDDAYNYASPVWNGTGTTAAIDNLADDTDYYFVVRAYVGAEESGDSNEVSYHFDAPAPPAPAAYTIMASAGTNGTLSPSGSVSVAEASDQTFAITANPNYHVSDVRVDNVSVGAVASYTFSAVDADHSISAAFAPDTYTIYATAEANGSISPSGGAFVPHGTDRTYIITANTGYNIADVVVDGQSVGAVSSYTFASVSTNHNITARFEQIFHTLNAAAGNGGTISPAGTLTLVQGSNQTYQITADSGFDITDVVVDGQSVGAISSYSFNALNADHAISATFTEIIVNHTIKASAGAEGVISPSGQITVTAGADQTFSVSAQEGYQVDGVWVDGISQGALSTYTFSNVNGDHTIEASFSLVNQPPVADAGPNQTVDAETLVTLIGTNSMDLDDGIASFSWQQIAGPTVALADPTAGQTTFIAPAVDDNGFSLEFKLTVTDYSGEAIQDTCIVNVTMVNASPVADAGTDQVVDMGEPVMLNATVSSDPDNDALSFQWRQISEGPVVTLANGDVATPTFIAPDVNTGGASVTFELTVTDAGGLQDTDSCMVAIRSINIEPLADAGGDQAVEAGDTVTLDGSFSSDVDGSIVKYQWKQTQGTPVDLSDASAASASFTAPEATMESGDVLIFELTVTDDQDLQSMDTCRVTVTPTTDFTAPEIQLVDPNRRWIRSRSRTISISGTAWDDREVVAVRWHDALSRSGVAQGTTAWRIDNLNLVSRKTTITITAYDAAGNQASVKIRIFLRR